MATTALDLTGVTGKPRIFDPKAEASSVGGGDAGSATRTLAKETLILPTLIAPTLVGRNPK